MKKPKAAARTRSQLDRRFNRFGPSSQFTVPVRGWIRAIREGLGLTTEQLAERLDIRQPSVVALEQSEAKGTIALSTLRRVAEALDCTVVYALVPNKPLDDLVRDRARLVLRRIRGPVEHSMLLEDQAVESNFEEKLDEFIRDTNPTRLWDEP